MNRLKSNYTFWDYNGFQKGKENRYGDLMRFDWDLAASLIRASKTKEAECGLNGDYDQTKRVIYKDEEVVINEYMMIESTWAIPVLVIDNKVYDCFYYYTDSFYKKPEQWPKSALVILKKEINK